MSGRQPGDSDETGKQTPAPDVRVRPDSSLARSPNPAIGNSEPGASLKLPLTTILGPMTVALGMLFAVVLAASAIAFTAYRTVEERRRAEALEIANRLWLERERAKGPRDFERERKEKEVQQELLAELEGERLERERIRLAKEAREKAKRDRELRRREKARLARIAKEKADRERADVERKLKAYHMLLADRMNRVFRAVYSALSAAPVYTPIDLGNSKGQQLSWRVHSLPKLGEQALYDQFHLDEPWDSPHNKTLIRKMPDLFKTDSAEAIAAGKDLARLGRTRLRTFSRIDGPMSLRWRPADITDSASGTALLFLVNEESAVAWTRPDSTDEEFHQRGGNAVVSKSAPLLTFWSWQPGLGKLEQMTAEFATAIISPAGGEHINTSKLKRVRDNRRSAIVFRGKAMSQETTPESDLQLARDSMPRLMRAVSQLAIDVRAGRIPYHIRSSRLSWRVHVLPYLGYKKLYKKFDHRRSWAETPNKELIDQMPDVFGDPATGRTRFRIPRREHLIDPNLVDLTRITDKREQTAVLFLYAPSRCITWTRPDPKLSSEITTGLHYTLGWPYGTPLVTGLAAGNVLQLPGQLSRSKMHALRTFSGGERFTISKLLEKPQAKFQAESGFVRPKDAVALTPVKPGQRDPEPISDQQRKMTKVAKGMIAFREMYRRDRSRRSPAKVLYEGYRPSQLSWRVHVLPFIGHSQLYRDFKFDEPWDSAANKPLLDQMPSLFALSPDEKTTTSLQILTGDASMLTFGNAATLPDGYHGTTMLLKVPVSKRVPWTKPDINPLTSTTRFADYADALGEVDIVTGEAQWIRLPKETSDELFRALGSFAGREILDGKTVARWASHTRGVRLVPKEAEDEWQTTMFRQIVAGAERYQILYKTFPPTRAGKNMKTEPLPLRSRQLSWRVHVLKMLGYDALFHRFHLEEAWDSEHNAKLLQEMPDIYRDVDAPADSTKTRVMTITGKDTHFERPGESYNLRRHSTDGPGKTLAIIVAPKEKSVPWTKPEDYSVDLETGVGLKELARGGLLVSDSLYQVRRLKPDLSEATIKALITPQGRESIDEEDIFEW